MMSRTRTTLLAVLTFLVPGPCLAQQEASSPTFVLVRSVLGGAGGPASSPTFRVDAVVGQSVQQGDTVGVTFGANTGYFNDIDTDGDGIEGTADLCPGEFAGCADADDDGCIDVPDLDADTDGFSVGACDCDDGDLDIWMRPGEVKSLLVSNDSGITTLTWTPPSDAGGNVVRYDTIRSVDPMDFVAGAACVESDDPADQLSLDLQAPASGAVFYYLVRAENTCAAGTGTLGHSSALNQRPGRTCS